ncbi:HAD hydrolase-like protein [Pontibacillus sp. ALD_SL1]|uniref:HAD hydrolase-like protein n=1 Tax=Pontibacillus sp. ALD_SL1 TaxID=2777185 RepID=UPI001A96FCDC|nr:HAD hydrolase-like protein [Pontibacillus sp. ALD_SL1]QSS98837.1 HAD hydrolase-like protein [Pontibacillus sp. ALD_SL1]
MSQAVIFDMDGTLFQTDLILEPSLEDTFSRLREADLWEGETPLGQYRSIMGVSLPIVWETLLPNHTTIERNRANEWFQKSLIENIRKGMGDLYPYTIKVLKELKDRSFSVFIASNGEEEYLHTIATQFTLKDWVSGIYSIQAIKSGDKSDLVTKVMDENKISKGLVVGDRGSDIRAAKANNLLAVGCQFDFSQEDELEEADVVIEDLRSVLELTT